MKLADLESDLELLGALPSTTPVVESKPQQQEEAPASPALTLTEEQAAAVERVCFLLSEAVIQLQGLLRTKERA